MRIHQRWPNSPPKTGGIVFHHLFIINYRLSLISIILFLPRRPLIILTLEIGTTKKSDNISMTSLFA